MSSKFQGAIPPPQGIQPNLVNPQSQLQTIWLASLVVILVVPSTLILLRLYVKIHILKRFTLADGCCVLAWLFLITLTSISFTIRELGVGLHSWDLTPKKYSEYSERFNIAGINYIPAIFFTKAAILLQFVDLFVTSRRNRRWWMIHSLIFVNAVFYTVAIFLHIFECNPRPKIWNPSLPGSCINIEKVFIATGTINVLDDLLILFFPLVWIWKIQIPIKRRLGIAIIFATGIFACIASVIRLEASIKSVNSVDITYSTMPVALWGIAEVSSGLIVFCLPVFPCLFRKSTGGPNAKPHYWKFSGLARSKDTPNGTNDEIILLDQLPEIKTSATANVLQEDSNNSHQGVGGVEHQFTPDPPRAIYRTVSIRQTSETA